MLLWKAKVLQKKSLMPSKHYINSYRQNQFENRNENLYLKDKTNVINNRYFQGGGMGDKSPILCCIVFICFDITLISSLNTNF